MFFLLFEAIWTVLVGVNLRRPGRYDRPSQLLIDPRVELLQEPVYCSRCTVSHPGVAASANILMVVWSFTIAISLRVGN